METLGDKDSTASEEDSTNSIASRLPTPNQPVSDALSTPSPTQRSIDVSALPIVMSWSGSDGRVQHLGRAGAAPGSTTMHVQFDPSSKMAFLRVRVKVALQSKRQTRHMFLFIHPECVRTLNLDDNGEVHSTILRVVRESLGTEAVWCLRFLLHKPAMLVGPKDTVISPIGQRKYVSQSVIDSLLDISTRTSFSVYLSRTAQPKAALLSLCHSASCLDGTPLWTMPGPADVASLYGGAGGKVIEHDLDAADLVTHVDGKLPAPLASTASSELLPSYEEISASAPDTACFAPSSKKRRRSPSQSQVNLEMILARIDQGFAEVNSRMLRIEARLSKLEKRVGLSTERALDDLRDDLERQLQDVRQETEDMFDDKIEDEMYVVRKDLTEVVRDEMHDAKDSLKRQLSEANVSVQFNFDSS